MTTLVVLFVLVLLGSAIAARFVAKSKGYDYDLFTLGGLLGGPWAVHAALSAQNYAVDAEDEAGQSPPADSDSPGQELIPGQEDTPATQDASPAADPLAAPPLPGSIPAPQIISDNPAGPVMPLIPKPSLDHIAPPALPMDAPQIMPEQSKAPMPALPDLAGQDAPWIQPLTPLADKAPPIPGEIIAPGIPQQFAQPALPTEIPAPRPIVLEPQDDEHKDQSVPEVADEKPQTPRVAPKPRSLVDLVGAEAPSQLRRGVEFYEEGGIDQATGQPAAQILGKLDEDGLPAEAVAPGEITDGLCPHCGHETWADWYGLCVDCLQPFPVRVAWFDPTAPVTLESLAEAEGLDGSGNNPVDLPGLQR